MFPTAEVAPDNFSLQLPPGARKLNPGDLPDYDELPSRAAVGVAGVGAAGGAHLWGASRGI